MKKIQRIQLLPLLLLITFQYTQAQQTRTEKDLLGEKQIPFNAYAIVKLAAARANTEVGRMKKERLDAIEKACQAVIDGKYHDQFLTDLYQGGAGTSANMNANEVLANIALEMSGHKK